MPHRSNSRNQVSQFKLQKVRETYENELAANRAMFSQQYDDKIAELRANLDSERLNTAGTVQELRELKTRCELNIYRYVTQA